MKNLLLLLSLAALFAGCGSKQYFKPDVDTKRLKYSGYTESYLQVTRLEGAQYEDGSVVTPDALYEKVFTDNNATFISDAEKMLIASSKNAVTLYDKKTAQKRVIPTLQRVVSANADEQVLCAVTADNSIIIYSIETGDILFKSKQKLAQSVASDFAKPLFFDDLVIFPTLDGKIIIVDRRNKKELREFIISSENYFNNVIYLQKVGDKIIAATKNNLLLITPKNTFEYKAAITAVAAAENTLYLTTVDGRIIELDDTLGVKNERKFPFARLVSLNLLGDSLYMVEKSGYLVKTDREFTEYAIYEIGDDIENFLFIGNGKIYYKTRFITLP